jgi:hypothetical protein
MKKKSLSIAGIFFLAASLIITSCSKTAPAGATGATGATGAAGLKGATGATGTANVIYSPWLNVTFQSAFDTVKVGFIPAPKLTDSIINQGDIKVYINLGSDSTNGEFVSSLRLNEPFVFSTSTSVLTFVINPYFYADTIQLFSNYDASSYVSNGYNYFQYRYILIPGGITTLPVSANGLKSSAINWNDYNQVKQYLGLKN